MSRFRPSRRRRAALAPLAVIALTPIATSTSTGLASEPSAGAAGIAASRATVPFGERVVLEGTFPNARAQAVEIRQRRPGSRSWAAAARTRTGAAGRFRVRVRPRSTGLWRGQLASQVEEPGPSGGDGSPVDDAGSEVDRVTDVARIRVRSQVKAKLSARNVVAGHRVRVKGTVRPGDAGRLVKIEVGRRTLKARTHVGGRFKATWRAGSTGTFKVRVRAGGNAVAGGSADRVGKLDVFRPAVASYYGPGLYGGALACGGSLSPSTIGVAHKTLPCGTKLKLRYHGRELKVRVIDRGPYVGGREFDLTSATKQRLGFGSTGTVLTTK